MTLLRTIFGAAPQPIVGATNIYSDPDSAPYPHVRVYERDGNETGIVQLTDGGAWLPLAQGGEA